MSGENLKAVIYARYSSHSQTEQSIEGQLRVNYEYATTRGISVVGEYIDRAISGTSADGRPEFQRMIDDSKKKQFDVILVYKLDRFARNRHDSAVYKHKLKTRGVKVISTTENISDNPEGIILESMLEALAEYYSKELSVKVRRGLTQSALNGTFTGGLPPFGYKVIDKKVMIDEDKAPIIKKIFEDYASGVGKKEIIDELNSKGFRSARGRNFTINSLQHCLKNQKYVGKIFYGGIEYNSTYPKLIEQSLFDEVQEKLSLNARAPSRHKAKEKYLLQGKAFCGHCGTVLVGESGRSKNGVVHHYYACSKKKKQHLCSKKNERKDFLEWYIVEQTKEYVLHADRVFLIAKKVVEEYEKDIDVQHIQALEKRLVKLSNDCDKVFQKILDTDNSSLQKKLEEQFEKLDLQKADLELDIAKLKAVSSIQYTEDEVVEWLRSYCNGDLFDMEFREKIIDTFVSAVYVYDNKITIFYNIKDVKVVTYIEDCEIVESDLNIECSDTLPFSPPNVFVSEHHRFFFRKNLFGLIVMRDKKSH